MIKKLIGIACLLLSPAAFAYNYDRWMCDYCELAPIGAPPASMDLSWVTMFIKASNTSIMNSGPFKGQPSPRWVPGDQITVCDGSICLTVQYQAAGVWVPVGGTFQDNGRGYKNVKASLNSGVVGGSGSNWLVAFRDVDYSGGVNYTRTIIITVSDPVPLSPTSVFGQGFSYGFQWSGGTTSDAWSAQGGFCRSNGSCLSLYSVPTTPTETAGPAN